MNRSDEGSFTLAARQRWALAVACALLAALFAFLIHTARSSVLNEIRAHAIGVAAAVAGGLPARDLDVIQGPDDAARPEYGRVQQRLGRIIELLPDIRYLYTMRPVGPDRFVYIVDAPSRDLNGNGAIDDDEISEDAGTEYDASEYPAMTEALRRPAADAMIRPDPPYPDLISGYAPIRDEDGRVVGIVGADIAATTIRAKLIGVYAVNIACGSLLVLLLVLVTRLHFHQVAVLEEKRRLAGELAERNRELSAANLDLARRHEQMQAELKLAQQVQLGFLPRDFPRRDRLLFDRFYITSEVLGGDLFDVFAIDHDRVAFYMADVAGHGVSAALISGLLKMAVTSLREGAGGPGSLTAQPGRVLARINALLLDELPDCEFITMVYAVLDLGNNVVTVASAGHPPPFLIRRAAGRAEVWSIENGTALGLLPDPGYPEQEQHLQPGDSLLFYTDGLVEAMDPDGVEFGEGQALEVVRAQVGARPADLLDALRRAVEDHRGGAAVSDDFSLLLCSLGAD